MEFITKNTADISKFTWITKSKKYHRCNADVSLSIYNNKGARVIFTFRNRVAESISNTGYVMFALNDDKLWFAQADSVTGYKMSDASNSETKTVQCGDEKLVEWARHRLRDYSLHLDKSSGLHFIMQ